MKNNMFKIRNNYVVNKDGTVCNIITNTPFQTYTSTNGDVYVLLQLENSIRLLPTRIDMLVLSKFTDRPIGFYLPYHIDGDKSNNKLSNLEWVEELEIWAKAYHPKHNFIRDYEISSFGNIREVINEEYRQINIYKNKGYLMVRLYTTEGIKNVPIHQIVCSTFNTSYCDGKVVNHIDGFKNNNIYFNLEFVTKRENEIHAGLINLYSSQKINDNDIIIIENLLLDNKGSCYKVYNYLTSSNILPSVSIYDIKRIKRRMNPNLFERLHGDYSDEKHKLIENVLKETSGRVKMTVDILRDKYNINTTESIVYNVKNRMNFIFPEINKAAMTDDEISFIKSELLKFNGHIPSVYNNVIKRFPRLKCNDITTIKMKMRKSGIHFPNGKTNIKITDSQREILLNILIKYDLSPSKTFNFIKNDESFKNVTIYDLKYLKRKYINYLKND